MIKKIPLKNKIEAFIQYDHESGVFTRMGKNGVWKKTGSKGKNNCVEVSITGTSYKAHRLAWAWMTGEQPPSGIDHIDGDPSNNQWVNLREANQFQNMRNADVVRKIYDLPRGVTPSKQKIPKFRARIQVGKKNVHLGGFDTPEEASEVYQLAAELLHGNYAYHLSRKPTAQAKQGGA